MFNKLLIKALKKRFKKFSLEEKHCVSELVKETIDDTKEKKLKSKKRRTKKMADEKVEEIQKTEEVKEEPKAEEKKEEVKAEEVKTEEVKTEVKDEPKSEPKEEPKEEPEKPVVTETEEPVGNGVRIEDLVTKDELTERFASLEAKLDAIINENKDLKDKLTEKDTELNGMKDKYENKDFGNVAKQGMIARDKSANSSFEEYSRQFM